MTEPLVSIIAPAYNKQGTINQSLQSIFDQSYSNWELIVIDDCSTDATKNMLGIIGEPRMKKIYLVKNQGVVNAYREGIKRAKGKYIMFHDTDDMSLPDRIEKCVAGIGDADVLYHSMYVMARHPDPQIPIMARAYRPAQKWETERIYKEQYIPGIIFAKAEILKKVIKNFPKEAEQAWDWMHHILLHQAGAKYTNIKEGLYEYYRFPTTSLSNKNEMDGTRQKSMKWIQQWLLKNKIVKKNHVFGKGFKGTINGKEERPNAKNR
jgi:glycosyltransferase involved in cell wall biosynthesis